MVQGGGKPNQFQNAPGGWETMGLLTLEFHAPAPGLESDDRAQNGQTVQSSGLTLGNLPGMPVRCRTTRHWGLRHSEGMN